MNTKFYRMKHLFLLCLIAVSMQQTWAQVAVSGSNGADGVTYTNLGAAIQAISATDQAGKTILVTLNQAEIIETDSVVIKNKGWAALKIQPTLASVTVKGEIAGAFIKFDGAANVTIDGRVDGQGETQSLTLANNSAAITATQTVLMVNDAKNNTVKYVNIKGTNSAARSGTVSITGGLVNGNDNNVIDHCNISEGATYPVCGIFISGTSATVSNDDNIISNCSIFNQRQTVANTINAGLYITGNALRTSIDNNRVFWTEAIVPTISGVIIYGIIARGDLANIKNNVVGYADANGNGLTQVKSETMSNRFIGMQISGGNSFEGIITATNNTVGGIEVESNTAGDNSQGVVLGFYTPVLAGSYLEFKNNTAKDISLKYSGSRGAQVYWSLVGYLSMGCNVIANENTITNLRVFGATPTNVCYVRGMSFGGGTASVTYTTEAVNNKIWNITSGDLNSTAANNAFGIQCATQNTVSIERNNIANISSLSSVATALSVGISLTQGSSTDKEITQIKNNMICLGNDNTGGSAIYGINIPTFSSTAALLKVYNNSVYIGGEVASNLAVGNSIAFFKAPVAGAPGFIDVKNNIFANVRKGGITGLHYAIRYSSPDDYSLGNVINDYNMYQIGFGLNNKFGSIGNGLAGALMVYTDVNTFGEWKTTCAGFDANSSLNNPQFIDPKSITNPNLHLRTDIGTPAKLAGVDLSEYIFDDIDGDFRPTGKFDIGADTNPAFTIPVFNFGEFSVPVDATYYVGNTLEFTVSYTMPVNVTGTPFIPITLNTGGTAKANYVIGSGSTLLKFVYTVTKGEMDADGIQLGSAIDLNGGSIKSDAEVNAVLTLPTKNTAEIKINGDALPQVLSVVQPTDKTYPNEANIDFKLAFNNYVTVDVTNGIPQIDFTLGSATVNAVYLSGSGTKELLFRYVVKINDVDADGIVVANAIVLNGGTIKDAGANDAVLSFSSLNTSAILVDATPPVVTSVIPSANGIYGATSAIFFTLNFNEPVVVSGAVQIKITFSDSFTSGAASYVSGSGTNSLLLRATITPASLAQDFDGIDLSSPLVITAGSWVRDLAGSNAILDFTVPTTTGILVDYTGVPAAITTVTAPADGKYTVGQNLDFVFEYDNAVTVTGTPEFNINLTGSKNIAKAYYLSGSGTTTLTFRYTVAAGDLDLDGIGIPLESSATTIHPINGTIKNVGSEFIAKSAFTAPLLTGVLVEAPSGIDNSKSTNQLRVFSANKTLHINGNVSIGSKAWIVDLSGKIVMQHTLTEGNENKLDIASLKGFYLLVVQNNNQKSVNKFIAN